VATPTDLHAHHEHDALLGHARQSKSVRTLAIAVVLTLSFAGVEFITGLISGSIALVADAGHMLTDSLALFLALSAQLIARRPPSAKSSYGHSRIEALAAFVNSFFMLGIVLWISSEAIDRFFNPHQVLGEMVMVVATIGLLINVLMAWLLSRDEQNMNIRAALVHVLGDLLGSVAALLSGAVIYFTGWVPIDPLLSLFVCALILRSTLSLLKASYRVLMEHVPESVDFNQVGADLKTIPGIARVHNLHIWEMSPGHIALTGHLEINRMEDWPELLAQIVAMLRERHGIDHVTLQPELSLLMIGVREQPINPGNANG
jgi:cobalt-zinc-cadmium efflux system protein